MILLIALLRNFIHRSTVIDCRLKYAHAMSVARGAVGADASPKAKNKKMGLM